MDAASIGDCELDLEVSSSVITAVNTAWTEAKASYISIQRLSDKSAMKLMVERVVDRCRQLCVEMACTIAQKHDAVSLVKQVLSYSETERGGIADLFSLSDLDGGGFIDVTELEQLLFKLGLDRADAPQMMKLYDPDESGGIDIDEFTVMIAQSHCKKQLAQLTRTSYEEEETIYIYSSSS